MDSVIAANPDVADKIRDGKVAAVGALIGQVMREMKGQGDRGALGPRRVDDLDGRRRHGGGHRADHRGHGIHPGDRLGADAQGTHDPERHTEADGEERHDRHGRAPGRSASRRHSGEGNHAVW